jgi:threonyl-tRNA synthetase
MDADFRAIPIPTKVKDAELMRIPYIIVIGDKEEKESTMAVRVKGDNRIKTIKLEEFAKSLNKEIHEKK